MPILPFLCMEQRVTNINHDPDNKIHGANMEPTWGRQDPGGPHVGHVKLVIWEHNSIFNATESTYMLGLICFIYGTTIVLTNLNLGGFNGFLSGHPLHLSHVCYKVVPLKPLSILISVVAFLHYWGIAFCWFNWNQWWDWSTWWNIFIHVYML